MKKSAQIAKEIFTFSLIVLVVLALAISLAPNSINVLENNNAFVENLAKEATNSVTAEPYGVYGKDNGYVEGSNTNEASNSSAYIATNGYSDANSGWTVATATNHSTWRVGGAGTKYYLNSDITITLTALIVGGDTNCFQGEFDGCGYTITLNLTATSVPADNSGGVFGAIIGGTVKNVRFKISTFNVTNNQKVHPCYVGAFVGLAKGATFNNCYFELNSTYKFVQNANTSWGPRNFHFSLVAGYASRIREGSQTFPTNFNGVTINFGSSKEIYLENTNGGSAGNRPHYSMWFGGLVAYNDAALNLVNIVLTGSNTTYTFKGKGHDKEKMDSGVLMGKAGSTEIQSGGSGTTEVVIDINGLIYDVTGLTFKRSDIKGGCQTFIGEVDLTENSNSSFSVSNIFAAKTRNSNNGEVLPSLGYHKTGTGGTTAPVNTYYEFNNISNGSLKIGLKNNKMWFGDKTSFSKNENNVAGEFISAIKFKNTAELCYDASATARVGASNSGYVAVMDKTKASENTSLEEIKRGKYVSAGPLEVKVTTDNTKIFNLNETGDNAGYYTCRADGNEHTIEAKVNLYNNGTKEAYSPVLFSHTMQAVENATWEPAPSQKIENIIAVPGVGYGALLKEVVGQYDYYEYFAIGQDWTSAGEKIYAPKFKWTGKDTPKINATILINGNTQNTVVFNENLHNISIQEISIEERIGYTTPSFTISGMRYTDNSNQEIVKSDYNIQNNNLVTTTARESGKYEVIVHVNGNDDYVETDLPITFNITKANAAVEFDDAKELYDSIIDYESLGKTYDFIYVQNSEYSKQYLNQETFNRNYNKYFINFVKANNSKISNTNNEIFSVNLPAVSYAAIGTEYLNYEWAANVDASLKNNYDLTDANVRVMTTGSGRNIDPSYTYCEVANTNNSDDSAKVRVRVVSSQLSATGKSDNNSMHSPDGDGINPPLYQYINSRYYDSNSTYAQITTLQLENTTWWLDRPFTGSRILPSYKTIDGNNATIQYKQFGAENSNTSRYATGISEKASSDATQFSNKEFPGFANYKNPITGVESTYYGIGSLLAVNYGTIINLKIELWHDVSSGSKQGSKMVITGHSGKNVSFGAIIGINAGLLISNTFNNDRAITFKGQGEKVVAGHVCGINTGIIASTIKANGQLVEEGATYDNYLRVETGINCQEVMAGVFVGINGEYAQIRANIDDETATVNYTNEIKTEFDVNGKLYAGAVVGQNFGSLLNINYVNAKAKGAHAGSELIFKSTGDLYAGGITGYNKGTISNSSFTIQENAILSAEVKTSGTNNVLVLGGIAGYNKGIKIEKEDGTIEYTKGIIENTNFENSGSFTAGNSTTDVKAYAVGGIAGVTDEGYINNCKATNRSIFKGSAKTDWTGTSTAGTPIHKELGNYLGLLIGVGCSENTVNNNNKMYFAGQVVNPGQLANSKAYNLTNDESNYDAINGYYGYIAGTYNTILENNINPSYQYSNDYSQLIWQTSSSSGDIYLFVKEIELPSVLGRNYGLGEGSDNINITGISGIGGVKDFGDNSMALEMLSGMELTEMNVLEISYKNPNWTGWNGKNIFNKIEAFAEKSDGTREQATFNGATSSTNGTANAPGSLTINLGNIDTVINSTKKPVETVDVYFNVYINITVEGEWLCFIGDEYSSNNAQVANYAYDNYIYCSGYATLQNGFTIDQNAYKGSAADPYQTSPNVLKAGKVLDGNNQTITFSCKVPNDGIRQHTKDDLIIAGKTTYVTGMLIALNEGTIKNLNISINKNGGPDHRNITPNINNYYNDRLFAFGGIAGVNRGLIDNCKVTVNCRFGINFTAETADAVSSVTATAGAICGINDGGTVSNSTAEYSANSTLEVWKNKSVVGGENVKVALGGAIGIAHGGEYDNVTTTGKGEIRSYSASGTKTIETYMGGVFGILPLGNNLTFAQLTFNKPTSINKINAFYAGKITSDENVKSSTALIAGLVINSSTYNSNTVVALYNAIDSSNIRVLSYGNVGAFQKHTKYEYSLYGYLSTYTKDFTKDYTKPDVAMQNIINNTYRIVLEDGSYTGLGIREQTTSVNVNSNGSVTINISWATDADPDENITVAVSNHKVTKKGGTTTQSAPSSISITNADITSAANRDVWYNIEYTVALGSETYDYTKADEIYNRHFTNFTMGKGNKPIIAGATRGELKGTISYNKVVSAVIELSPRKYLCGINLDDGSKSGIQMLWQGNEAGNNIMGMTDVATTVYGNGDVDNDAEYNLWYEAGNGVIYYGVSDLISINRGTIDNIKVTYLQNKYHNYNSLYSTTTTKANVAFGAICGINLGTVKNCEVITNCESKYIASTVTNAKKAEFLISPGIGLNNGTFHNSKIDINKNFEATGSVRVLVIAGAAAVNAYDGNMKNIEVILDGNLTRKATAKEENTNSGVVFGGIVGINDGGAINRVKISGSATISVSSEQNKSTQVQEKDDNGDLIYSDGAGHRVYKDTDGRWYYLDDAGVKQYIEGEGQPVYETILEYCNDAGYLYFALGVAISNNEYNVTKSHLGHEIASCVEEVNGAKINKVSNIIIAFNGNVEYNIKGNHMMGIAFAKASDYASNTNGRPAYEGIIIVDEYGGYLDLYSIDGWLTEKRYSGTVVGLALPLMGHVNNSTGNSNSNTGENNSTSDSNSNTGDFVKGGRITSNVGYSASWDSASDDLILNLALDDMLGVERVRLEFMPEKSLSKNLEANTDYVWTTSNKSKFTLKRNAIDAMFNTQSYLMQIEIFFKYPYVQITDAFQLRQFMEFDQNDSAANVKAKYFDQYVLASLAKVGEEKKITSASDISQKSWFDTSNTTLKTSLLSIFTADEMYEHTDGRTYVLEKFAYIEGSTTTYVSYYSAKYGQLASDIILDRYNKNETTVETIDVGWNTACKIEFDESKRLTGAKNEAGTEKYTITLVANSYDYGRIGDAEPLVDIDSTPAYGTGDGGIVYCLSAFTGILRGTIDSVDFIFRDNSQINITKYENGVHGYLDMKASIFTGLIAGYSTGTINNCNLEVGNNTQFFINKKITGDAQNGARTNTLMGGMVGLMGRGSVLSNATVNMGDNSIFAITANGYQTWGIFAENGEFRNYVGGLAGMMIDGSLMYNVKIEGSESSLLMSVAATDANETYKSFFAATGGIVGCNTNRAYTNGKDSPVNYSRGLGRGTIDGVIFNWKGACLTMIDENNKSDKNLIVIYYGGGAFGYVDDDTALNTYYAFDIVNFKKYLMSDSANNIIGDEYKGVDNNGHYMPIHNREGTYSLARYYSPSQTYYEKINENLYVKVANLTPTLYEQKKDNLWTTRTYDVNLNYGSNNNIFSDANNYHTLGYSISFKDAVDGDTLNARKPNATPEEKNSLVDTKTISVYEMTNENVTGEGLSHNGTKTELELSGTKLYKYTNVTSFSASAYTQKTDLGDLLTWGNTQRSAPIYCKFTVVDNDVSSVMWSINIRNATPGLNNTVKSEQNVVTNIPIYQFATSIEDANRYKEFNYIIERSQGDGMEIYYCTGDAAVLSPDKRYYYKVAENQNEYNPLKAIMYDGKTEGASLTIDVYNKEGNAIDRLQAAVARQIYQDATTKGDMKVTVEDTSVTGISEDTSPTKIGSYKLKIEIFANAPTGSNVPINPNAYVSETYRTQFFNAKGEQATQVTQVTQENSTSTRYLVDTYIVNIVIAPISISFTNITKEYDENANIEAKKANIVADVVQMHTYSLVEDLKLSFSASNCSLTLSDSGTAAALILQGKYFNTQGNQEDPSVGEKKMAKLNLSNSSFTYTIYEKVGDEYKPINITQRYLLNKTGEARSYFTIVEDYIEDTVYGNKVYVPKGTGTEYTITDGQSVSNNKTCKVAIVKNETPLVITANFDNLYFNYTGANITPEQMVEQLDYTKITITHEQVGTFDKTKIEAMFRANEITLSIGDGVKDVAVNGYDRTVTIEYKGNNFTAPSQPTTEDVKVYVKPKAIDITKVIKKYDTNDQTNTADFTITGTYSQDNIDANDLRGQATYASVDVNKNKIAITITPTHVLNYNNVTYNVVTLGEKINYYVDPLTYNVGIITPLGATIKNAYKTYDGTNSIIENQVLILDENNAKLDYNINATFTTINAGETTLTVILDPFTYDETTHYLLTNDNTHTNYEIVGATSTTYTTGNIAYIKPKEIIINYAYKVFDNTTSAAGATFIIEQSGFVPGDTHSRFDGEYATANVVYSAPNTYNTINLNASKVTFKSHSGTEDNVYCLTDNNSPTNYTVKDIQAASNKYALEGKGVIIPKELTISKIEKTYDKTEDFDSRVSGHTYYSSGKVDGDNTTIHITATFTSANATSGSSSHGVTITSKTTFSFNGTSYDWLHNPSSSSSTYNYCVGSGSIEGTIKKQEIKIGTGTAGQLYNLEFTVSTNVESDGKVTFAQSSATATYTSGQKYEISNLTGKFKWNNIVCDFANGEIKHGSEVVAKLRLSGPSEPNASTTAHSYTLSLTSDSINENFEMNSQTLKLTITKRAAESMSIPGKTISREYNGTTTTGSTTETTSGTITVKTTTGTATESISSANVTFTYAGELKNAGTYSNALSATVNSITHTNYTFSGVPSITNRSYTITPKQITVDGEVKKAFDGTNSPIVIDTGITGESLLVEYTGLGVLPGIYSGETTLSIKEIIIDQDAGADVNEASTTGNYTITKGANFALNILNAKIVVERYLKDNQDRTFNVAASIPGLKGLTFLATETLTEEAILAHFTTSNETTLDNLKTVLASMFMVKYNDGDEEALAVGNIGDVRLQILGDEQNRSYALEFDITKEKLDNVTYTDRYMLYMATKAEVESNIVITPISNKAESSSELEAGQFNGDYSQTETQISNADQLIAFINGSVEEGHLTGNIHNFDATKITATTFNKKLNGNGYTISLIGGVHSQSDKEGFFLASNAGELRNINFVFASIVEIETENANVGLVVGENSGTIENCSLKILNQPEIKEKNNDEPILAYVAGFAAINTGTISNVSVIFSADVTLGNFAGVAYTSSGAISYVAVRQTKGETISLGTNKAIVNNYTNATPINYAIKAINADLAEANKISKVYDSITATSNTKLEMFGSIEDLKNGYIDYYFATNGKITTNSNKHNEYVDIAENENTSYYYGYSAENTGYTIAIETIAPYGQFIWEAYGANYTTYGKGLNRAVAMFSLTAKLEDSGIGENAEICEMDQNIIFITSEGTGNDQKWVTIFNPALGKVVTAVIADGADTIRYHEYNGSQITATFNIVENGVTSTVTITGTDVGTYSEYFSGAAGGAAAGGDGHFGGFDIATRSAKIVTTSGSTTSGSASIMLIITPKASTFANTWSKPYDTTNIAEAEKKVGNKSIIAIGAYNDASVNTGKTVKYTHYTKKVAIHTATNTFLTCYQTGAKTYTVAPIYIGNQLFETTTTAPNNEAFAKAYNQLISEEELVRIANNNVNQITYTGIASMNLAAISYVDVYDLCFNATVDATSEITYGIPENPNDPNNLNRIYKAYHAGVLYVVDDNINTSNKTVYKNEKIKFINNVFSGTNIVANSDPDLVVTNSGTIEKRVLKGTYSNLNQSYRDELKEIKISIAKDATVTGELPKTITTAQIEQLKAEINSAISSVTASNASDVLSSIAANNEKIEVRDGKYYAKDQKYTTIAISGDNQGIIDIGNELFNVQSQEAATLTLRYFRYDEALNKYKIETIDDFVMIGNTEDYLEANAINDYDTLHYYVTKNINAKSKAIKGIERTFKGSIVGSKTSESDTIKTIKNLILTEMTENNTSKIALFKQLDVGATVSDIRFVNVLIIPIEPAVGIDVLASENYGTIKKVEVEGQIALGSESATINPVGIKNTKTVTAEDGTQTDCTGVTQENKVFMQVNKNTNVTVQNAHVASDDKYVIMFRQYGKKTNIAGNITSTSTNVTNWTADTTMLALSIAGIKENIVPLAIENNNARINNFRQYWVYINVCPWLAFKDMNNNSVEASINFIGKEFER